MAASTPILARATINLPEGITPGELYWVDPDSAYIQACIRNGYFVPEPDSHAGVNGSLLEDGMPDLSVDELEAL